MMIEQGWMAQARRCPSPNADPRPARQRIDTLVIHNISLPPGQYGGGYVHQLFQNQLDPTADSYFEQLQGLCVSSHFLIERGGELTQFVSCDERAWHAGQSSLQGRQRVNDRSIGIELEGCDTQPFTEAQYQQLERLGDQLLSHYRAISLGRILGHSCIAPGRKTDPGPYFDWARCRAHWFSIVKGRI